MLLLSIVLLCLLASSLVAVPNEYSNSLGVQVGRLSGVGLSYQKWTDTLGYEIAGGVLAHPLMENGSDQLAYIIGLQAMYPVVSHEVNSWLEGTLYIVGGVNHQGYREAVETPADSGLYVAGDLMLEVLVGGGIGVETIFFTHFAICTEFVYMGRYEINSGTMNLEMQPQLSVRYRF